MVDVGLATLKRADDHGGGGVDRVAPGELGGHRLNRNLHLAALLVDAGLSAARVGDVTGKADAPEVVRCEQGVVEVVKMLLVLLAERLEEGVFHCMRAVRGV